MTQKPKGLKAKLKIILGWTIMILAPIGMNFCIFVMKGGPELKAKGLTLMGVAMFVGFLQSQGRI